MISRDPALASMGLQELQKGACSLCAEQHKGIRISRLGDMVIKHLFLL